MSIEVIHGDCLDVLRGMPDSSVDAVVTDPPYGINYAEWDATIPPQETLDHCLRVSRGPVMWFGWPQPERIVDQMALTPRPDRALVWAPGFSLSKSSKSRIFFRYHIVWCWRMPTSQKSIHSDVLRDNCEGRHWWDHPATKPLALMRKLVGAALPKGGTVLDPFAGSGTTLVAAQQEGMSAIGIEREAEYVEIIRKRIGAVTEAA